MFRNNFKKKAIPNPTITKTFSCNISIEVSYKTIKVALIHKYAEENIP